MSDKIHYAAIDIGSNAVRLLIKCVNEGNEEEMLSKVQLIRVPLRLGMDTFTLGKIHSAKVLRLISLMKCYKELMNIYDVRDYRACATSAMREAVNREEIVKQVYRQTGIIIEVIDGHEEAKLISDNKIEKMIKESDGTFVYCDVGGGSTEINIVRHGELISSKSFDIGTVRFISGREQESERTNFINYLKDLKSKYDEINIIGSGGNINKLLRLGAPSERSNINFLPADSLRNTVKELNKYNSEERMIKFRLKPDRADVIVPAGNIFIAVLDIFQAEGVIVPKKGLADGILDSIYNKYHNV